MATTSPSPTRTRGGGDESPTSGRPAPTSGRPAPTPADTTPTTPPPQPRSLSASDRAAASEAWSYAPLPPERVRWHYLTAHFARAAATDAPKAGGVKRFGAADSAALEAAFRADQAAVERAWWVEAAEMAAGPSAKATPGRATAATPAKEGGGRGRGGLASHAILHGGGGGEAAGASSAPASASASWGDLAAAEAAGSGGGPAVVAPTPAPGAAPSSSSAVGTPVRGGAWEVDLSSRTMAPCYHPAPPIRVRRGTWFVEAGGGGPAWSPLAEGVADEVEEAWSRAPWRGGVAVKVPLSTAAGDLRGAAALLAGPEEAYLLRGGVAAWAARALPGGSGGGAHHAASGASPGPASASAPGPRLRRGYAPPAHPTADPAIDAAAEADADAAAASPVAAIIFAVHGVGQNLAASNITDDAASLARALAIAAAGEAEAAAAAGAAAAAASPASPPLPPPPPPPGRVLVVPVQWRKHLALDVDATAARLQPPSVRSLRGTAHATAVEVLLYLMPAIAADMAASLACALNAQWARFLARHPGWGDGDGGRGKASILAHSLGSVLAYDILCAQAPAVAGGGGGRTPSPPASPAPAAVPAGLVPADLTDLTSVLSPSPAAAAPNAAVEVRRLRAEVGALRAALAAARGDGSVGGAGPAGPRARGTPGAAAAPPPPSTAAGPLDLALAFDVDQLICVGSPLGLFLALRRVNPDAGRGLGTAAAAELMPWRPHGLHDSPSCPPSDGLPACARLYNLFHPSDLVAHRLEPLVCPSSGGGGDGADGGGVPRPVWAPRAGGSRLHVGLREAAEDVGGALAAGAARVGGLVGSGLRALRGVVSVRRVPPGTVAAAASPSAKESVGGSGPALSREAAAAEEEAAATAAWASARAAAAVASGGGGATPPAPPTAIWRLTGGPPPLAAVSGAAGGTATATPSASTAGRLDFQLQTGPADNAYLAALGAHFMYWGSPDVALLALRAVTGRDVRTGAPLVAGKR